MLIRAEIRRIPAYWGLRIVVILAVSWNIEYCEDQAKPSYLRYNTDAAELQKPLVKEGCKLRAECLITAHPA